MAKLQQFIFETPNLYATTATEVRDPSAGTYGAIGDEGAGYVYGSDVYLNFGLSAVALEGDVCAIWRDEIDIRGLEFPAMVALDYTTMQGDAIRQFAKTAGRLIDYTIISTVPLSDDTILKVRAESFGNPLPFDSFYPGAAAGTAYDALITKEQVITGQIEAMSNDSSMPVLGAMRTVYASPLNMGNIVATDKIYLTRVVFGFVDFQTTGSYFLDIPARTDILSVQILDPNENVDAMAMIRSIQAPSGSNEN